MKNQKEMLRIYKRECCRCDCVYNVDDICFLPQPCPLVDYFQKAIDKAVNDSIKQILIKIFK